MVSTRGGKPSLQRAIYRKIHTLVDSPKKITYLVLELLLLGLMTDATSANLRSATKVMGYKSGTQINSMHSTSHAQWY